jgi:hypothetical protein
LCNEITDENLSKKVLSEFELIMVTPAIKVLCVSEIKKLSAPPHNKQRRDWGWKRREKGLPPSPRNPEMNN